MRTRSDRVPVRAVAGALVLAMASTGCAEVGPGAGRAKPVDARVSVELVRASDDGAAIADEAGRIAGVAVDYAAAMSPAWHAIVLRCPSAASCVQAIARLQKRGDVYATVERDARMRPQSS